MLDVLLLAQVRRRRLARQHSHVVAQLIWRTQEQSRAFLALREQLERATS